MKPLPRDLMDRAINFAKANIREELDKEMMDRVIREVELMEEGVLIVRDEMSL